jgi:type I restriction enzyme M protein
VRIQKIDCHGLFNNPRNDKQKGKQNMFEQTLKNIDDILYKDSGSDSELDYIGQTSWVLFLRYLEDLEQDKADHAALEGKEYEYIIEDKFRWPEWAMPKTADGKLDHHKALTGPDLVKFVDYELFPYLSGFKQKADHAQTIEYKIGEIFSELKNKIQSGYNLREIIELADDLPFRSTKDKHELSHLYETKIKNMGNAGRNGGQYYTPRPLIRAMIQVTKPQIGEKVYDGAVGSAGFLCEAFDYMYKHMEKNTDNLKTIQEKTFYGKEKKNLAYVIGIMNMILHGIEAPNIIHTNTLGENIRDIQEKDRYHVILANPPFGGKERKEVQQNFDIKTGETAFLFLQHFIKSLKAGGRAAIVIKNTFLSNTDNASVSLRKHLLETCNLHSILDMPGGTFLGAGVKTVVLFFQKGEPTKKTWYYQMNPGRNMGKTNSLNDNDLKKFVELQKTKPETEKSWMLKIGEIATETFDLSVKNPNTPEEAPLRSPEVILAEMEKLDIETKDILKSIKDLI